MFGFFKKPAPPPARLSYEDSCRRLHLAQWTADEFTPMRTRRPGPGDDEERGLSFFRTRLDDTDDLSDLTLPRTFFGRSEVVSTIFRNTDLSESVLCWNDFVDVDFSGAALARSDLRASNFTRVRFAAADLSDADLRLSDFEACTFAGARMARCVLTPAQGRTLPLSRAQRAEIAWTDDDGPEPQGG